MLALAKAIGEVLADVLKLGALFLRGSGAIHAEKPGSSQTTRPVIERERVVLDIPMLTIRTSLVLTRLSHRVIPEHFRQSSMKSLVGFVTLAASNIHGIGRP